MSSARGQGTSDHPARSLVVIELAGEPANVAAVEDILRERVGPTGLEVSFTSVEEVDPVAVVSSATGREDELAHVWIDLRSRERITFYLLDGKRERVLVRHFVRYENPEVAREELGHVVELALVALRAGESIGVGRDVARAELAPAAEPPPPAPAAAPAPPPREAPLPLPPQAVPVTRLRMGAFYEVEAYAGGPEVWSGPGLVGEVRRTLPRSKLGYGALVSGQYRLPSSADVAASTSMRFTGGAMHLLAVGSVALSRPAELALGIGGGLNLLHVEARGERSSEVRFAEGSTRVLPTLRAMVRYEHAVPSLRLFAGIGLDVPLDSARYLLARPGETVVLFEAWSARPFVLAGIQTP